MSISSLFCTLVLPPFTQADAFTELQYSVLRFTLTHTKTRLSASPANPYVSSASPPRWGILGWYGLGGPAEHENWGEKGQEGKAKATWGFLRAGADAGDLGPFVNRAPLKSGYPLFNPWGLRSTGSTTTWRLATTSTFPPLCPSETGKCNLFRRWGTRARRPAGFMEVTGNQNKSQARPVTPETSFISSGTGLWVRAVWISLSSYWEKAGASMNVMLPTPPKWLNKTKISLVTPLAVSLLVKLLNTTTTCQWMLQRALAILCKCNLSLKKCVKNTSLHKFLKKQSAFPVD